MYDRDLSLAELERMMVLLQHHLRQIRVNNDVKTAHLFNQKLGKVSDTARRVARDLRENVR